ncbi:MAG: DUF1559 domain-containing protein [Planctomycetes bacterium]|nr:DUF1559 domain-containing protein [Planctomycetota bacterium]
MAINVACQCGKAFRVKDEVAGRRVKCPACGRVLDIPEERSAPPLEVFPDADHLGSLQNAASMGYDPLGQSGGYPALPPRRGSHDGLIKGLMILAGASIGLMMLSMVVLSIVSAFRSPTPPNDQLAAQPAPPSVSGKAPAAPAVASSAATDRGKAAASGKEKSPVTSTDATPAGDTTSSANGKEKAGPPLVAMSRATLERLGKPEPLKGAQVSGPDKLPMEGYSWMVQLLPHLGHEDLYKKFDFSKPWDEDPNEPLTMQVIPAFLNPSDSRDKWEGYPFDKKALTHFVGVSGIEDARNVVAAALPRSDPRAGMFGYDQVAKPSEVTDGTSQTIMIIGSGELAAPWAIGGGATIRGAREPYFHEITGFGSKGLPKRGSQAVMADGSVRFISADIDPQVFKSMCTIHGAESVDLSANPHVTAAP